MSHSKKKRREHKKQGRFNLFPPDASLGIIGGFLPIVGGNKDYLDWVGREATGGE